MAAPRNSGSRNPVAGGAAEDDGAPPGWARRMTRGDDDDDDDDLWVVVLLGRLLCTKELASCCCRTSMSLRDVEKASECPTSSKLVATNNKEDGLPTFIFLAVYCIVTL